MTAKSVLVGQLIRQARQRRGWSLGDLSMAMGRRRAAGNAIAGWERGNGVGVAALLDCISAMPELGDQVVILVREAQRRRGAQPPT